MAVFSRPWRFERLRSGQLPTSACTSSKPMHLAYMQHAEGCYETSLEDISIPVVEALCPTLYDYVYFA